MLKAQSDQKRHADKHRREEQFAVGDEVLLSTRDLLLAADTSQQHRAAKLTGRFIGPLKVTRVINPNAYELELPPQLRIHPVQNISKLRHYIARRTASLAALSRCTPTAGVQPTQPAMANTSSSASSPSARSPAAPRSTWSNGPATRTRRAAGSRARLNCPDLLAEFLSINGRRDDGP